MTMNRKQRRIQEKQAAKSGAKSKKDLPTPPSSFNFAVQNEIELALASAQNQTGMQQYDTAKGIYRDILKKDPQNITAIFRYGDLFRITGDLAEAEKYFKKGIALHDQNPESHNQLGSIYQQQGKNKDAVASFQRAITLKKDYADPYINISSIMLTINERGQGKRILKDALENCPPHPLVFNNLGAFFKKETDFDQARYYFEKGLKIAPNNYLLNNNLGDIFLLTEDFIAAEKHYLAAYNANPNATETLCNLAIIFKQLNELKKAFEYGKRAVTQDPTNPKFNNLLGDILYANNQFQEALFCYEQVHLHIPKEATIFDKIGCCYRALESFDKARDAYLEGLALSPGNESILINISRLCLCTPAVITTEEAIAYLEQLLTTDANNAKAQHLIASLKEENPTNASSDYIRQEFDDFAESFDQVLQNNLGYKPSKLYTFCKPHLSASYSMLDIGCGTGLSSVFFAPQASAITGIDLSPKMIEKAHARGIYHYLIVGDCITEMNNLSTTFDLIVSADMLIYLGDLTDLFTAAHDRLTSEGLFAFTTEKDDALENYKLFPSGRYKHSSAYIEACAKQAGFTLIAQKDDTLRHEGQEDITGTLYLYKKP